jgi:hypothetical protein
MRKRRRRRENDARCIMQEAIAKMIAEGQIVSFFDPARRELMLAKPGAPPTLWTCAETNRWQCRRNVGKPIVCRARAGRRGTSIARLLLS